MNITVCDSVLHSAIVSVVKGYLKLAMLANRVIGSPELAYDVAGLHRQAAEAGGALRAQQPPAHSAGLCLEHEEPQGPRPATHAIWAQLEAGETYQDGELPTVSIIL